MHLNKTFLRRLTEKQGMEFSMWAASHQFNFYLIHNSPWMIWLLYPSNGCISLCVCFASDGWIKTKERMLYGECRVENSFWMLPPRPDIILLGEGCNFWEMCKVAWAIHHRLEMLKIKVDTTEISRVENKFKVYVLPNLTICSQALSWIYVSTS